MTGAEERDKALPNSPTVGGSLIGSAASLLSGGEVRGVGVGMNACAGCEEGAHHFSAEWAAAGEGP